MGKRQIILLATAALVLLIATIWLLTSLAQLYQTVALLSPFLARLLVGVVVLLLLVAIASLGYYGWLFLRPRRRRQPRSPKNKTEAAAATLTALDRQIRQIQDDVARQALEMRSQRLGSALDRQDIKIVIFGVGAAGKTSLINAISGDIVGETAAPMGTTQAPAGHRLTLTDLDRDLILIDTPGIAEASVAGTFRETTARQLAAEADLLLFVIDNDLRRSEYAVVQSLLDMGKRLLLVFNKSDRYPEEDLKHIMRRLSEHFLRLDPRDIIAVAADPQPLPLADGTQVAREPDILPLLERLAGVLRQEGDTLIADTLLLQSQHLSQEAQNLIGQQRQHQAEAIVERYQWISAGVIALTPLPGVDLLAAAAINAQMVVEISRVYDSPVSLEEGKRLALSLAKTLTGLGIVKGSMELLAWGLQVNIATALAGRALQGVSAAYLTRIAGKSFIEYFRANQDWGDGGMVEVVQTQFQLNKRQAFIQNFVQEAIAESQPLRNIIQDLPNLGQRSSDID